jgi:hypothetical protein
MCTIVSKGATIGISHRAQEADDLRKSSLGLPVRELVMFPIIGQSKSVIAEVRVTL